MSHLDLLKEAVEKTVYSIYPKELEPEESISILTKIKESTTTTHQQNKYWVFEGSLVEDIEHRRLYKGNTIALSLFENVAIQNLSKAIDEFRRLYNLTYEEAISMYVVLRFTKHSKKLSTISLSLSGAM